MMRAFALLLLVGCGQTEELPVIATLPAFELRDQQDRPYGLSDMKGHVTVVSFIFTTCRSICPTLTTKMRGLQERFSDRDVRFVSFSVDPESDTPAVLREYARNYHADERTWTFLTGPTDDVNRAVVRGFRVAMGERSPGGDDIMHSSHFVLVDAAGRVRGYYASDDEGSARLERDLGTLGVAP